MNTKIPESSLNDAERKVLNAFLEHEPAVPFADDSPVTDKNIRGDFLRDLFLGEYDEKADYRGTCIVGAVIDDVFNMEFCETKFPVRFHNCTFAQKIKLRQLTCPELYFCDCTLKNGVNAVGAKVAGSVSLRGEFNAMGEVNLVGAEVGQLDCPGGSFQNEEGRALNAQSIKVAAEVFLCDGFNAEGEVFFANATIGGSIVLEKCKLTHLSLAGTNVSGEFQDDAQVYKNDQGDDIELDIDGFRYQRLNTTKERIENRLEWVGSMSRGNKFYPQPYEQLMKVYREMGHMNWARRVGFELEKKRHKQLRLNRDHKRFVVLGWVWWMWYWILRATIGYGYKPFRTLWWFPFAIVVGLPLFSGVLCPQKWTSPSVVMSTLGNGITEQSECERWRMLPSDVGALVSPDWRDGEVPPDGYPKFIPLFYAIEVALPVLALGQTSNWQPESLGLKWIQGIFIIIGAVALAVPASYRTGFLNPRWWD